MMMDMPDSLRWVAEGERPQPKTQPRIPLTVQVRKQQLCLVFKRANQGVGAATAWCSTKTQRQPASPQALAKQFKAH